MENSEKWIVLGVIVVLLVIVARRGREVYADAACARRGFPNAKVTPMCERRAMVVWHHIMDRGGWHRDAGSGVLVLDMAYRDGDRVTHALAVCHVFFLPAVRVIMRVPRSVFVLVMVVMSACTYQPTTTRQGLDIWEDSVHQVTCYRVKNVTVALSCVNTGRDTTILRGVEHP